MVVGVEKTKMRLACNAVLAIFQPERSCSAHISCPCRLFVTWHGMTDARANCPRVSRMQLGLLVPGWADAGRMELQHRDGIFLHAAPPRATAELYVCFPMIVDASL
jgi:hypothetical protein